jgi:hypothetical protein
VSIRPRASRSSIECRGLEAALLALWGDDLAIQLCTVHKHRNLLPQTTSGSHFGHQE